MGASKEHYDSTFTDSDSNVEHRDHDSSFSMERPKSLSVGGARLISLEEAQTRHNRSEFIEINKTNQLNTPGSSSSYIEVGGGPSSLPDKYHTVLPVPRSWQKRKTHSWRSLFSRGQRSSNSDMKGINVNISATATPSVKDIVHTTLAKHKYMEEEQVKHISLRGEAAKSIDDHKVKVCDSFDGTPLEICVRSSSADSVRTAGHSRSVSHDSYFDILQSPLRGVAGTPSREFSELGINFDREEPEMRIFSESESLVSSPRVPKDAMGRRIVRSRPDDHASAMHCSVNPSPKKQPRLNTPSPSDARWATLSANRHSKCIDNFNSHGSGGGGGGGGNSEEIYRKRYKLENQSMHSNMEELHSLSKDFQFIDCTTPEHTTTANSPNPMYGQAESKKSSQMSLNYASADNAISSQTNARSSPMKIVNDEGRRSYSNAKDDDSLAYVGMGHKFTDGRNSFLVPKKSTHPTQKDVPTSSMNLMLRSNSNDVVDKSAPANVPKPGNSNVTPSSPMKSPRYSLLVGETSSENSSSMNTPIYELDTSPRELSSRESKNDDFMSVSGHHAPKNVSHVKVRHENEVCVMMMSVMMIKIMPNISILFICLFFVSHPQISPRSAAFSADNSDLSVLKKELSLDLGRSRTTVDEGSFSTTTPNNTQTSGNTSQSMTPSEFGYHNLNRPSPAVSLDNSPKSDAYEQMFHSRDQGVMESAALAAAKSKSPIKSTINITYNVKPPATGHASMLIGHKVDNDKTTGQPKNVLETNFDESMVYEQIHVFNNTISEINNMLENGNIDTMESVLPVDVQSNGAPTPKSSINNHQTAFKQSPVHSIADECVGDYSNEMLNRNQNFNHKQANEIDNATLPDQKLETRDSIETIDANASLYENVQMRKPPAVYENMHFFGSPTKVNQRIDAAVKHNMNDENIDSLDRPSSFTVRQLANKFQASPNEMATPIDFSKPFGKKSTDSNQIVTGQPRAKLNQAHLNRAAKITRSLDENAFVREFGNTKLQENINRSTQQLIDVKNILTENSTSRRSSIEYNRPKSMNPSNRLSDVQIATVTSNDICKANEPALDAAELQITPTTENPISLIQQNVMLFDRNSDDEKSHNITPAAVKSLGVFKLDRDRIEKIKEERRLQLNEKFRSESFKCDKDNKKVQSKSKTELSDLKDADRKIRGSLQFKSKSRGEIYNTIDADAPSALTLAQSFGSVGRVRRISDEKNHNTCGDTDRTSSIVASREREQVSRNFERRSGDVRFDRDCFGSQFKVGSSQ